jgi:hypothetical protein
VEISDYRACTESAEDEVWIYKDKLLSELRVSVLFYHYQHPLSLLQRSLVGCKKSAGLTDQAPLTHCAAKNFLPIWHVFKYYCFLH